MVRSWMAQFLPKKMIRASLRQIVNSYQWIHVIVHEESRVVDHVRLYGHGVPVRQPVNSDVHLLSMSSRPLGQRGRGCPNQFELKRPKVLNRQSVQSAPLVDRGCAAIHTHQVQEVS